MSSSPALARVALRGAVPRDLFWMLPLVGLDPFGVGGLDSDLVAAFSPRPAGASTISIRRAGLVLDSALHCDNSYVAAAILLSRALHLPQLYLVADRAGFALLGAAVTAAAGHHHILIEGPTGAGKGLLARLLHRAGRPAEALRPVNCADPLEVAAELRALQSPALCPAPRTVLFDRFGELPPAQQRRLAARLPTARGVRYLASLATGPNARARLSPPLLAQFPTRLRLAPLHRRPADLVVLARYFLHLANPDLDFAPSAIPLLMAYSFPGNIRELRNLGVRLELFQRDLTDNLVHRDQLEALLAATPPPPASPTSAPSPHPMPSRPLTPAIAPHPDLPTPLSITEQLTPIVMSYSAPRGSRSAPNLADTRPSPPTVTRTPVRARPAAPRHLRLIRNR